MAATLAGALIAVAIPFVALRGRLGGTWRPRLPRREALALLPVIAGMLAITLLTTDDLVAAKVSFTTARGRPLRQRVPDRSRDPLPAGRDRDRAAPERLGARLTPATAPGACSRTACSPQVRCASSSPSSTPSFPHLIVRIAFGAKYQGAASLLWMFAIAMSLYSLLNVVLVYRLGHHETRTSWLLLGGAAVQAVLFVALPLVAPRAAHREHRDGGDPPRRRDLVPPLGHSSHSRGNGQMNLNPTDLRTRSTSVGPLNE